MEMMLERLVAVTAQSFISQEERQINLVICLLINMLISGHKCLYRKMPKVCHFLKRLILLRERM